MPCEVRAYRRFSIFLLQFRHLKQLAQKAWSPVRIARSSILFPQLLQLYVQLLQIRDPSPRRRRFASESSRVPHVLHRKQSICHLLPAKRCQSSLLEIQMIGFIHQAQKPFLPPRPTIVQYRLQSVQRQTHLSASLTRICSIVLIQRRFWVRE